MRINITPIDIDGTICSEAEVQASLSTSVAIRIIPVDVDGTEYPEHAFGVVGAANDPDVQEFLSTVSAAVTEFITNRGY